MRRIASFLLAAVFAVTTAQAQVVAPAAAPPAAAAAPFSPNITITAARANGLYAVGETVRWTVRQPLGMPGARYTYEVRENNLAVLSSGALDLSGAMAVVEGSLARPGMITLVLKPVAAEGAPAPNVTGPVQAQISAAAAVGIRDIRPSNPRPADFKTFWDAKLAQLRAIPVNPRITKVESGRAGVTLGTVQLDSVGSTVQGYLATPDRAGKFPALVIYQYAGVYALEKETSVNRAAEGWLAFNVGSHDMPPTEATAPRNYASIGNNDRETSYFLNMYLRDTRALDFIRQHPGWDGKTIVIMGTSMGGQQSFATAGLNPGVVTAMVVNVPSGANIAGDRTGQRAGYPNWNTSDAAVAATAPYFDAMSFAPDITAAAIVAPGFIDVTSPPFGIIAAFNQINGPKELVPMVESDHNHITPQKQNAWLERSRAALEELRSTGRVTVNSNWDR
jgi:cephalosporin-C deacetylase-like acetyl esterase